MMNFYSHKEAVKVALINCKYSLNPNENPNDWALITYAFSLDGKENNLLFKEMIDNLSKWASDIQNKLENRYLLAISLYIHLSSNNDLKNKLKNLLNEIIKDLLKSRDNFKFSVLNDPTQVFSITLALNTSLQDEKKDALIELCKQNLVSGKISRRLLYAASLLELDVKPNIHINFDKIVSQDIIYCLWFFERYKKQFDNFNTTDLWKEYSNINKLFKLTSNSLDPRIQLSILELVLLYEAISYITKKPDPRLLFEIYPLHTRIRDITKSLFHMGEYVSAVFEATKILNDIVREKTGYQDGERALMQKAFGGDNPKIKFKELKEESTDLKSQKNEQEGLKLIAEGIFAAFRNPKGHEPKDKSWGDMSAYEALDQLVCISYLVKRIEESTNNGKR